MSDIYLNSLLKEYERKKLQAELDLEKRKQNLYDNYPEYAKIEDQISSCGFSITKNLLNHSNSLNYDFKEKLSNLKVERSKFLKSINLDDSYLNPNYECNLCKDTGYIMDSNFKTSMCSCLKQKLLNNSFNKSNMSNLSSQNFNKFNDLIFSDEVDLSKYKFNISPRKNIVNIKNKCIEFVNNFDDPNQKNLLFTGNTGLGKTYMSNCIADALLKKGKTVLYQTAPILIDSIINYKMSKQKDLLDDICKSVLDVDLLIIDDLGTESLNSMKLSELFTVLNTRILNLNNKCTKTIISTNLSIKDIFQNYEERIGSRIVGYYDIYYFYGDDLRFKNH